MKVWRKCGCGTWYVAIDGRGRPRVSCGKCKPKDRAPVAAPESDIKIKWRR